MRYWWPVTTQSVTHGLLEWWGHAMSHASLLHWQCCWLCNVPTWKVFMYIAIEVSNISLSTQTMLLTLWSPNAFIYIPVDVGIIHNRCQVQIWKSSGQSENTFVSHNTTNQLPGSCTSKSSHFIFTKHIFNTFFSIMAII